MSELTTTQATSLTELNAEQKAQLLETYKKQTGQDLKPEILEILPPGSPVYTTLLTILKASKGGYSKDTTWRDVYKIDFDKENECLKFTIPTKVEGDSEYSWQPLFYSELNSLRTKTTTTPLKDSDYYLIETVRFEGKSYCLHNSISKNIVGFRGVLIKTDFGAEKSVYIEDKKIRYCSTVQAHPKGNFDNPPTVGIYPVSSIYGPQFPFAKKDPDKKDPNKDVDSYIPGKFLDKVEMYGKPTEAWVKATEKEVSKIKSEVRKCSECIIDQQYSWSPNKEVGACKWKARAYFLITHFIVREPLNYHLQTTYKLVQYPLSHYNLQPLLTYHETTHVRYNTLFGTDNNAIPCKEKEGYVKVDKNWFPLAEFARQAVKATRNFRLDANLFPEEGSKGIQKTWDITENMYYITPIQVAVEKPEHEKTGLTLAASVWHEAEAYGSKLQQLTNFGWLLKAGGTDLTYPEEELIFNEVSTFYNPENDEPEVEDLMADVEFDVDDVEVDDVEVMPEEAEEEQLPSTRPLKQRLKRSVLLPE